MPSPDASASGCPSRGQTLFLLLTVVLISYFVEIAYICDFSQNLANADLINYKGQIFGRDFINMWTAAKLALSGHLPVLFDHSAYWAAQQALFGPRLEPLYWSYPPHMLLLVAWFGHFPYVVGLALWTVLTFSAYAFAIVYKRPKPWALVCVLLFAPASFENLTGGQNGFLTGALLIGGFRLLETRPSLAGVLFGLLSFKPQLGLLVPFALIARRQWRTIAVAAVTVLLFVALSVLVFGVDVWKGFFAVTAPFQSVVLNANPQIPLLSMVVTPFMGLRLFGASLTEAYLGSGVITAVVISIVMLAFEKGKSEEALTPLALTGSLLVTPYALTYDMTVLAAAVLSFVLASRPRRLSDKETAITFLVWVLPMVAYRMNRTGIPVSSLLVAAFFALQAAPFVKQHLFFSRRSPCRDVS